MDNTDSIMSIFDSFNVFFVIINIFIQTVFSDSGEYKHLSPDSLLGRYMKRILANVKVLPYENISELSNDIITYYSENESSKIIIEDDDIKSKDKYYHTISTHQNHQQLINILNQITSSSSTTINKTSLPYITKTGITQLISLDNKTDCLQYFISYIENLKYNNNMIEAIHSIHHFINMNMQGNNNELCYGLYFLALLSKHFNYNKIAMNYINETIKVSHLHKNEECVLLTLYLQYQIFVLNNNIQAESLIIECINQSKELNNKDKLLENNNENKSNLNNNNNNNYLTILFQLSYCSYILLNPKLTYENEIDNNNNTSISFIQKVKELLHFSYPLFNDIDNEWNVTKMKDLKTLLLYYYSINITLWDMIGYNIISEFNINTIKSNEFLLKWKRLLHMKVEEGKSMYYIIIYYNFHRFNERINLIEEEETADKDTPEWRLIKYMLLYTQSKNRDINKDDIRNYYKLYKNELEIQQSNNIQYKLELMSLKCEYKLDIEKNYNDGFNSIYDLIYYCKENVFFIIYIFIQQNFSFYQAKYIIEYAENLINKAIYNNPQLNSLLVEGLIISKKYNLYSYITKIEILQLYFLQKNNIYELSGKDVNENLKMYLNKISEYFNEYDKSKYTILISSIMVNIYKTNKEMVNVNDILLLLDRVLQIVECYESRMLKKSIFMLKSFIFHLTGDKSKREEFAKMYNLLQTNITKYKIIKYYLTY